MPNTPTAPAGLDPDAPKPRTDDGGEILDPAILERQRSRTVPSPSYRCFVPAAGKLGWATNRWSRGEVASVSVRLDGEGDRCDLWHPSQVLRIHLVGPATVGPLAEAA